MTTTPLDLLLAEEDPTMRTFVRFLLPAHCTVYEADRGRTALQLVQLYLPDCVLLNWHLPDIGAPALIQTWSMAHIPVIVLTDSQSPQAMVEAMAQGAQDYLLKEQLSTGLLEQTISDAQADVQRYGIRPSHRIALPSIQPAEQGG
jgi:DNA-binding response OmpR family regulator